MYTQIECDAEVNVCRWTTPCSEVQADPIELSFRLYDSVDSRDDVSYPFELDWNSMKIPGTKFGATDDECFFPVF